MSVSLGIFAKGIIKSLKWTIAEQFYNQSDVTPKIIGLTQ